jgi:DNA-directed RNA polymerase subunit RPC12/RpoP
MTTTRTVTYGQGNAPVPPGVAVYPCARCRREFMSDRSPMAEAGFCMLCRPHVRVSCRYCGERCRGRHDGQEVCQKHREMSYEELQRLFPLVTPGKCPKG